MRTLTDIANGISKLAKLGAYREAFQEVVSGFILLTRLNPEDETEEVSSGKLTGIQLRTIAAKDQLDALLEDRLFDNIKLLAQAKIDDIQSLLEIERNDFEVTPTSEAMLKTISAMALFCYTEIVERGLKQSGNGD